MKERSKKEQNEFTSDLRKYYGEKRIEMLKSGWWDRNSFKEFTGIDPWKRYKDSFGFYRQTEFMKLFRTWGKNFNRGKLFSKDGINYVRFQQFCYHFNILPLRVQAIRLSLNERDYIDVFWKMYELNLIPRSIYPCIIDLENGDFVQKMDQYEIERLFPPSKIQDFHERINSTLGLNVRPIMCGREKVNEFDCLTGEPIGNKNVTMLQFKGQSLSIAYYTSNWNFKKYKKFLKEGLPND